MSGNHSQALNYRTSSSYQTCLQCSYASLPHHAAACPEDTGDIYFSGNNDLLNDEVEKRKKATAARKN